MSRSPYRNNARQQGMALVVTLSLVVIATVILVAFITAASLDRAATAGYGQAIRAEQLAQGGLSMVVGGLRQEVAKDGGSTNVSGVTVYTNVASSNIMPQRAGVKAGMGSLVKVSANVAFYTNAAGGLKGSDVKTTTGNEAARPIRQERWSKPQLVTFTNASDVPSWVYVARGGPVSGGTLTFGQTGATANNAALSNTNYVMGRFAYAVYDVGGLLDITVAGYPSAGSDVTAADAQKKGLLAFAELTEIPGFSSQSAVNELVEWRNRASLGSSYTNHLFKTGATNGFLKVAAGDNTFLSRADLIAYAQTNGLTGALPYLTTFTRERNSASCGPGSDAATNPDFRALVVNGKPLQRFALSRFQLLDRNPATLTASEKDEIFTYFGLSPATGAADTWRAWKYRAATIGTPQAAIAAGREPDVFELIKGAITAGSLGADSGLAKTSSVSSVPQVRQVGSDEYTPETNVDQQVARIVANLIDQSDADNYPTTIIMGSNPVGNTVYGIENLPYFADWLLRIKFPSGNMENITGAVAQMRFRLWNPHQGTVPGKGPTQVRVRVNPEGKYGFSYFAGSEWKGSFWNGYTASGRTRAYPAVFTEGVSVGAPATYATPQLTPVIELAAPDKGFPAGVAGTRNVEMANATTVFVLEYLDASGQWRPYTTFAGYADDGGATGIQSTGVWVGNNTRLTTTSGESVDWQKPEGSYPKPDPRTFRYRTGYARGYDTGYPSLGGMVAGGDPGQVVRQKLPAYFGNDTYPGMLYRNDGSSGIAVKDADGTARKGDGYLGANPMVSGSTARPVVLNRPFRSVGELGYVFRDIPWKSLNFFSTDSGDAALLDVFCLEDSEITAGRVNLNTANAEVLAAILKGGLRHEAGGGSLSSTEAAAIAAEIVTKTGNAPFVNRTELVKSLATTSVTANWPAEKIRREAVVRALASVAQTRTWNLMIDIIAQAGKFSPKATAAEEFVVEGERRMWLHVAIDRITGEVLESRVEPVYE